MAENLNRSENLSQNSEYNFYVLETDSLIKDSLADGEFAVTLESRLNYFNDLINEKTTALVDFITSFISSHEELVQENLNLESLQDSGIDMQKLSELIQEVHLARNSYLAYIVDLELYLQTNYPELQMQISTLVELSDEASRSTFIGGSLSRLYPNLNEFINSKYKLFLEAESLVDLETSLSKVSRMDLQLGLDERLEMRVENILNNTYELIDWTQYPSYRTSGADKSVESFMDSDLGHDLKDLILNQLKKGYSCEPLVNMIDGYNGKDALTPYKRYQINFRVFNEVESAETPVINAEDYYHPYIHGFNRGDMNISFLQRMSGVNLDYQADLAVVPEWNGDLSQMPSLKMNFRSAPENYQKYLRVLSNALLPLVALKNSYNLGRHVGVSLTLEPLDEVKISSAIQKLLESGDADLRNYALNAKSILNKRSLFDEAIAVLYSDDYYLEDLFLKVQEIQDRIRIADASMNDSSLNPEGAAELDTLDGNEDEVNESDLESDDYFENDSELDDVGQYDYEQDEDSDEGSDEDSDEGSDEDSDEDSDEGSDEGSDEDVEDFEEFMEDMNDEMEDEFDRIKQDYEELTDNNDSDEEVDEEESLDSEDLSGYTVDEIVDRYNSFSDEDLDSPQYERFINGISELPDSTQGGFEAGIDKGE